MKNIEKQRLDELVKKELAACGLTKDILTKDELEALREEIKAKENGLCVLDGVLSNPELLYRRFYKKTENEKNRIVERRN